MDTPNASTFNQKLPVTEIEGEELAETSPTPRKASTKDEGDVSCTSRNSAELTPRITLRTCFSSIKSNGDKTRDGVRVRFA
jgi:hypothetical protein